MTLTSRTAVALWVNEVSGQISDGMWENARPNNHWQFWCRLQVIVGDVNELKRTPGGSGTWCLKNSYALTRLHQSKFDDGTYVLRDRMIATGRMAKCVPDVTDRNMLHASEYMPATFAEFRAAKQNGTWQYDFVAKYMENVTEDIAAEFYQATYTLKEMNRDLKLIMDVMHTVGV